MVTTEAKIEHHQAFLKRKNEKPLIGCIHGWENLSKYVQDTEAFFPKGDVVIQDLTCNRFLSMYETFLATLDAHDDLFRTLEPLPFFPWTEAAIGCPITYTGKNFWSSRVGGLTTGQEIGEWIDTMQEILSESVGKKDIDLVIDLPASGSVPETGPAWLVKYGAFLDFLSGRFSEQFPIGQSILRGPLDMAAAVFGEERMIYLFFDHPSVMKTFLDVATSIFLHFITIQHERTPPFCHGSVIGSYYLWTPGTCLRLQEDAMALLSPTLYREFVHPKDCAIASAADYSLFHLHSSGLHLLDILLENEGIDIVQVSKDEGVALEPIIPSLLKIQESGKCLLLKGRLNRKDLQVLEKTLDFRGLCIQAVVLNPEDADDLKAVFQ